MKKAIPATEESAGSNWKRPKQHYDLIEIWWVDISAQDTGWKDKVDKIEPTLVHSVGFLVHQDKDHVVIAMDVAHDKEHNQRSQIPVGTIQKIHVIKKATVVAKRRTKNVSVQCSEVSGRDDGSVPPEKVDREPSV